MERKSSQGGDDSSILRMLAETPLSALDEELLGVELSLPRDVDRLALQRVRELVDRRRRREKQLSILYSTARLTALRGVDEALDSIVHSAHELIDADITYLTVLEEDGSQLRVRAQSGAITPPFQRDFRAPPHVGIAGHVARTLAPLWVPDYLSSTEFVHDSEVDAPIRAEGIVSMLGVPLVAGDRYLGTLNVANRTERTFAADDIDLLSAFGHHAAVALENSRLYDAGRRSLAQLQDAYRTIEEAVSVHEALTRLVLSGARCATSQSWWPPHWTPASWLLTGRIRWWRPRAPCRVPTTGRCGLR